MKQYLLLKVILLLIILFQVQILLKVYENYLSILNKYCTSSLVERILESEIDYDPFINAQDVSAVILDYLKVTPVEGERDSFEV